MRSGSSAHRVEVSATFLNKRDLVIVAILRATSIFERLQEYE